VKKGVQVLRSRNTHDPNLKTHHPPSARVLPRLLPDIQPLLQVLQLDGQRGVGVAHSLRLVRE